MYSISYKLKYYLSTKYAKLIIQVYKIYTDYYYSTMWGGTSQYNFNKKVKAVKIILNCQYYNIANSMDDLIILEIHENIYLKRLNLCLFF